jgi:hypothetical protein
VIPELSIMRLSRWLLSAALALVASHASAYTYVMTTDAELDAQSSAIVVARVIAAPAPVWSDDGKYARGTRYALQVREWLRGDGGAKGTQTLYLPGTPDATTPGLWIAGVPRFAIGDEVLIFAQRNAVGDLAPVQLSLGVFARVAGKAGDVYVRALGDAYNADAQKNAIYGLPRVASRFEAALRSGLKSSAPDYFALDEDADLKFTHLRGGDNIPVRWFEFDTSTNVQWKAVVGGQAGTSFDEFASVSQAVSAWASDPGSRITVTYGGTVASDTGNNGTDGNNSVIWNDPGNDIPGTFNCSSGTLAIGGPFFTVSTSLSNGLAYHDAVEGFVIVQDGAGCFLDGSNGANGAEMLTHEIGHALGLGHSCGDGGSPACGAAGSALNQAVMRATVHADGRGASLGTDDRAGMAFIYPDSSGLIVLFANGFE